MAYLHNRRPTPLLHRDLKSPNLLLDNQLRVKVGHHLASRATLSARPVHSCGKWSLRRSNDVFCALYGLRFATSGWLASTGA